jgi:hypothetical protein
MDLRLLSRVAVTVSSLIHLWAAHLHGTAHAILHVSLTAFQSWYVYLVIIAGPTLAAIGIWTRHFRSSLCLFTVCMFAAFGFGVVHHYLLVSPDNVMHLPAGPAQDHHVFTVTANALAVIELCAAAAGGILLSQTTKGAKPLSERD